MAIIVKSDFVGTKDISKNVSDERLNVFISEAERLYLPDYLGAELYYRIITDTTNVDIQKILTRQEFECNGEHFISVGLKTVLVNFSYSRYVLGNVEIDTPFGFVRKDNDFSTPTPYNVLASKSKEAKDVACADIVNVLKFIECNIDLYPEYKLVCKSECSFDIDKINKL